MIWRRILSMFDKFKNTPAQDIIPPWHHEITPESQKRRVNDATQRQKETVERLRMEMRLLAKQHSVDE